MPRNNYMAGGLIVEPKSSPPTGRSVGTSYLDDGTNTGSGNVGWRYLVSTGPDVWDDVSGGGGGAPGADSNLWTPPDSPSSHNDEFDNGSFSGWQRWNQTNNTGGNFSWNTVDVYDTTFDASDTLRVTESPISRPSWAFIQPGATKRWTLSKIQTPDQYSVIMARVKFIQPSSAMADNDKMIGIAIWPYFFQPLVNDSNGVELFLNRPSSGATQAVFRNKTTSTVIGSTTDVAQQGQALEYIAIHVRNGVYHGWVGTAGGNWIHLGSTDSLGALTNIGFIVQNNGTSGPGVGVVAIDFFRYYESMPNFLF